MKRTAYLVACIALTLTGCVTVPPRADVVRLLAHPEAMAAAKAAPHFFSDAMNTIAQLDHELNAATK